MISGLKLRGIAVKWIGVLVVGAFVAFGGGMLAVGQNQNVLENSLEQLLLKNPILPVAAWADIQIEGRDVTLNGVTTDKAELDRLINGLEAMPEVASITNNVEVAPIADPFEFEARIEDGDITIVGHMPSAKVQTEFEAQLDSAVKTEFTLASGGPSANDWRDVLTYSTRLLNHFDQGEISATGLKVSFSGRAKDHQSYRDLDLIADAGFPDKLKRGTAEIIPPFEEDYVLRGTVGETGLTLSGVVPTPDIRNQLEQVGADVSQLLIASGAPDGFGRDSLILAEQLDVLQQGEFSLSAETIQLAGTAQDFAAYDSAQSALAQLQRPNVEIDLPLPTIEPFTLTLASQNGAVSAVGFVPQDAENKAFFVDIDENATRAANGAPENFEQITTWMENGRGLLGENWSLSLVGDRLNVSGQAKTPRAYVELLELAASPPNGLTVDMANLALAVVEPYEWSLSKSNDGALEMAGYLPDSRLRQTIYTILDTSAEDTTLLAAGEPERFDTLVTLAAKTIDLAASGEAVHGQSGWKADIVARDLVNKNNILQLFSNEEIQPDELGLEVAQLPPPVQNPYRFEAVKSANGTRTFEGYVPNEEMLINLADQGELDLDVARGAPEQFEEFVALGNSILTGLETGVFRLDGAKWTISGEAATFEAKSALMAQIENAGLGDGWTINISSPEKLVSPYLFSAEKTLDDEFNAAGYAPTQDLIDQWADRFGWRAQIQRGAGAPEGFNERVNIGLNALELLDAGRLSLVDGQWALIGRASSDEKLANILDVLATQSDAFLVDVQIVPQVEDLLLQISKSADGTWDWSGYLEDQTFWEQTSNLPVSNGNVLPEREAFHRMIELGVDALSMLNEGEVIHAGGQWSISGEAPDQAVLSAVELILDGSSLGPWYTTITAPPVPVVEVEEPAEEPVAEPIENEEPATEEAAPEVSQDTSLEESDVVETTDEPEAENVVVGEDEVSSEPAEPVVEEPADQTDTPETAEEATEADQPSETEPAIADADAEKDATSETESEPATEMNAEQDEKAAEEAAPADVSDTVDAEVAVEPAPDFELTIEKSADSGITISGDVPDAAARYTLELSAGADAKLDVAEADGAPERFLANALTITQALSQAETGNAALIGGEWTVGADVSSFDARDQLAAILDSLPNARVTINTPPAHKLCNANVEQLIADQAILFQSGSARITDGSRTVLTKIADQLANCPEAVVEVEGHTDSDGDDLINLSLSVQRAETVVSELVEMGVEADRLYALGFGETLPIADNDTRQGKAQNRRIVFTVRPPLE